MALTNEQYDTIMRIYNHKQMRNHQIVAYRTDELYSAVPTLHQLDAEVSNISISSITSMLDGGDAYSTLNASRQKLAELKAKRDSLITSAGYPADYLEPPYDCPDCKDTGFIDGKRCHCFKQAAINMIYKQSNISTILSKENFDSYDINLYSEDYRESEDGPSARDSAQLAYRTAKNFVQNFRTNGGNLLLLGQTGCGKTFLSNCIAKALLDQGHSVIYFTAFELFDIFEKQVFKKDSKVSDLHEQIFECDLLIIDDLGTEVSNSFTNSKLFECLNERLLRGKSTIISTNFSRNELRDAYSERITSRVLSCYTDIHLIGEDIRIKKVINNK
ncbi:MAG: ATP-binding protein [Pseudobutyrivibrio sp.]|nr:ATP-binding protein [Pseudobutyrivibrio sp.]